MAAGTSFCPGKFTVPIAIAMPGWRKAVANDSAVRSSRFAPPIRCPPTSPARMNVTKAKIVPLPIRETIAGQAVNRMGMTEARSKTVAPSETSLAIRSENVGARRLISMPAASGAITVVSTRLTTASGDMTAGLPKTFPNRATATGTTRIASRATATSRPKA